MSANGNTDHAFGLRPLKSRAGTDGNGSLEEVAILAADADAYFMGTPVRLSGDSTTGHTGGVPRRRPGVVLCAPGERASHVIVNFEAEYGTGLNNDSRYRTAGAKQIDRFALAKPILPGELFEIQANDAVTEADPGMLFDMTAEAGNLVTGRSTVEMDVATAGTGDGQLQFVRIIEEPRQDYGTAAGTCCVVRFNENLYSTEAGGV